MANLKEKKAKTSYERAKASSKPGEGTRFKALVNLLKARGRSQESAERIAAYIGRRKYGAEKFAKMAAKARKKAH